MMYAGKLHLIWEDSRALPLVPGADRFRRLAEQQSEK